MAEALEVLKRLERAIVGNGDGQRRAFELLSPLSDDEFHPLEVLIPCPILLKKRGIYFGRRVVSKCKTSHCSVRTVDSTQWTSPG
jgi:hypothetical protein